MFQLFLVALLLVLVSPSGTVDPLPAICVLLVAALVRRVGRRDR